MQRSCQPLEGPGTPLTQGINHANALTRGVARTVSEHECQSALNGAETVRMPQPFQNSVPPIEEDAFVRLRTDT